MQARILIIEDDQEVVSTFQEALEMEGYEIEVAYSGEDGWEQYQQHYYDVVIVDWKMGKMDGVQVLKNINDMHPNAKVIMITGFGDVKTVIEAQHYHAFDCLQKPVDMKVLLQTVQEALKRRDSVIEALEEWVETHPEEANRLQLATLSKTGEMQVWSERQVLEEIKRNTPFGRKEYKNLIKLTIDLLTRGKVKSDG
jgi:DNA-binding NtrC family response regulator